MLSNKEIRYEVIEAFKRFDYIPEHINVGNTYHIFDFGEESVVHFKIKGCKRWLFGLWVVGVDGNKTKVCLFGEHEDYIDKFKPTQTKLSEEIEVSNDISNDDLKIAIENLVWSSIYDGVEVIRSSSIGGKVKFYYHGHKGVLRWLFGQWWFYRIENPFRNWLKYHANKYVCMAICSILNMRYGKRLKAMYEKTDDFSPAYMLHINYKEGVRDDDIYKVYCRINGYVGFGGEIEIEHIPFGEKRGIGFVQEKEDDE